MNSKTMLTLGLITAGLLVAGFYVAQRPPSGSARADTSGVIGQPLFPELKKRLADVAEVEIASKDATIKLSKIGATWGVADKGGYPVDFDKVKQVVVGLSEMDVVAAMTANPNGHSKLGVEEPTAEEATSKRVTVKDPSGAVLADVIVGKTKPHQGMGGKGSLYVRKPNENQAWQVHGQINVAADLAQWLAREVSKLEGARVQRVRVQHPDGNVLTIAKSAASDANYTVEGLPEGAELSWPGVASGLASALQYMSLDDVQPRDKFDPTGGVTTQFECFDGMVITAVTVEREDKTWLTLDARFDESLRAAPVGPPAPVGGEEAPETPPTPELRPVEEVTKEVDELNAKWSRWAYAVPGYSASNLRKKMSDLLKQETPPGAEGGELDPTGTDSEGIDGAPPTDLDEPSKEPIEKPGEKPAESPAMAPTDAPTKTPIDEPAEKPAGQPIDPPTDGATPPADKPTDG